jgi:hypothetical protein
MSDRGPGPGARERVAPLLAALLLLGAVRAAGATSGTGAAAHAPSVEALLRSADAARHPIGEGIIKVRATVREPGAEPAVSEVEVYVQGSDRSLCIFRSGPLEGRRILSVADRVWLIVPGSARAIPVNADQRLLGGGSIADLARVRFADQFDGTLRPDEETRHGDSCFVVDLKARSRKNDYAAATLWIGSRDTLPRAARFTLRSGKDAKEVRYTAFGPIAGRTAVRRMEIEHLMVAEQGWQTTLEFIDYESLHLDPGLFEPAGARAAP